MLTSDLNLDDLNPDQLDNYQKTGGKLPNGKYHVRLDGAKDVTTNRGTSGTELEFLVLSGPHAESTVRESLWVSEKEGAKRRVVLFSEKLGLLQRKGGKFVRVAGKDSFNDALGAECVIDVEQREYTTAAGKKGSSPSVTFTGIYSVNEPGAGNVAKVAKAGATPPPPKKKAVDASDL